MTGYTPHQAAQLQRWIVKHGFAKSALQSDTETSLMQLVNTVATDFNLPTRVSPPHSHQSQRKVERLHRTSLINFGQHDLSGVVTSKLTLMCFLRSHFHGHFNTAHHPEQLPRSLIREDVTLRELPLQLPLQHRWFWRMCSRRRPQHPDTEATTEESSSETSSNLAQT